MKKRNYHVIPRGTEWAVKREGNKRITVKCRTQGIAINYARLRADRYGVEVIIHRRSSKIRDSDSYGNEGKARDHKH